MYKKNISQNEVLVMADLENLKVVEHNDLITGMAKMNTVPFKIFEMAVSCIDIDNPPKNNEVYVSKEALFSFLDVSGVNKNARLKGAIESLQEQKVFEIKEDDTKGKGFVYKSMVAVPYVEWSDFDDKVTIEFSRHIMPYLIDLKNNFTQYNLMDISKLTSKHSIILYKWLTMNYNQFEKYNRTKTRTEKQLLDLKSPIITVKELREITDTINFYKRFDNFEKRVIEDSLKEINEHTHFNVTYEKIKRGRSISEIQFFISKKAKKVIAPTPDDNEPIRKSREEQEQEDIMFLGKAMQSQYTKMLSERFLIGIATYQNTSEMVGLQRDVYPIYEEMEKIGGKDALIKHFDYLLGKNKEVKYSLVGYLKKSATQELNRLKINRISEDN